MWPDRVHEALQAAKRTIAHSQLLVVRNWDRRTPAASSAAPVIGPTILTPAPGGDPSCTIHRLVDGGLVRLVVVGEVDMATSEPLAAAIGDTVSGDRVTEVIVDLADVSFLDAAGIRTLALGYQLARGRGVRFSVANPRKGVEQVMRITGVLRALTSGDP